ncbi:MAG: hypothetical protein KF784_09415 [Fimbriimonadaceae bacterium]|nr:hypothetical protein [Fimbriimonadaceae bacterium]
MGELTVYCNADSPIGEILKNHPGVGNIELAREALLEFSKDGWHRRVWSGKPSVDLNGLVELIDNNPLVCADEASVPSSCATLALIALGPLIRAGILVEPPALQFSETGDESEVNAFLSNFGWTEESTIQFEAIELGNVCALNAIANIQNVENWQLIDDLYEEAYGRSFYISRSEDEDWDAKLVEGTPNALYRLRITPGEPTSLLTIQVMADRNGKCGAAQIVHAMNVMAGFEETLGIS